MIQYFTILIYRWPVPNEISGWSQLLNEDHKHCDCACSPIDCILIRARREIEIEHPIAAQRSSNSCGRSYLHLRSAARNPFRLPMLRSVCFPVTVNDPVGPTGPWTTTWMPNSCALQVHFLSVAEGIATLCASGARRVEMMIITGLQDLAADVTTAVGALHAELLLVVFLAVRHPISVE